MKNKSNIIKIKKFSFRSEYKIAIAARFYYRLSKINLVKVTFITKNTTEHIIIIYKILI